MRHATTADQTPRSATAAAAYCLTSPPMLTPYQGQLLDYGAVYNEQGGVDITGCMHAYLHERIVDVKPPTRYGKVCGSGCELWIPGRAAHHLPINDPLRKPVDQFIPPRVTLEDPCATKTASGPQPDNTTTASTARPHFRHRPPHRCRRMHVGSTHQARIPSFHTDPPLKGIRGPADEMTDPLAQMVWRVTAEVSGGLAGSTPKEVVACYEVRFNYYGAVGSRYRVHCPAGAPALEPPPPAGDHSIGTPGPRCYKR